MRRPSMILGALLGGITTLPVMALMYLGERLAGLPFVPFDLFDWLARVLPGAIIGLTISVIVKVITTLNLGETSSIAKRAEQTIALGQMLGIGLGFGAVIAVIVRRQRHSGWQTGVVAGTLLIVLVAAVEFSLASGTAGRLAALLWPAVLFIGWGAMLGAILGRKSLGASRGSMTEADRASRRAMLARLATGSLGLTVAAWGLGWLLPGKESAGGAGQPLAKPSPTEAGATSSADVIASAAPAATSPAVAGPSSPLVEPPPATIVAAPAQAALAPAPGTRPVVTPNQKFYRIDINTRPPHVDGTSWKLEVAGLFATTHPLTMADLMAYPAVTQPTTIGCISNEVGGDLISTSKWTGLRLRDLLHGLGLQPQAKELAIQAVDGFYESVTLHDMLDARTLLVYGMNGETLPVEHGYPLRIYIPNHYGMKQPKWITRIEAIDHTGKGFWVDRGWSQEAHPQIESIIDTVAKDKVVKGRVPVGGIAWAGDRGIRKVEVQVDDRPWAQATLLAPPLGPLTWVLWRYDWPRQTGDHIFRVRATDGTGMLQIEQPSDPEPNGATGYHAVSVSI